MAMVVSKSVWNSLMRQDRGVIEELTRAKNMSELSKTAKKEIKRALKSSEDRRLSGMTVVELSKEGMAKQQGEKNSRVPTLEKVHGMVFGRDMNLDGSLAANLDAEMKRAERLGVSRSEARTRVASSVLDFHTIYRNSQDAEKALGTAREVIAAPEYQPDRQNEVSETMHEAINFGKYAKWNNRRDEEERKRREEAERQRLEEERISRDEREEPFHIFAL